jgi:hypothetical protein
MLSELVSAQRLSLPASSLQKGLARLFSYPNAPLLLEGGYAMELRLRRARYRLGFRSLFAN